MKITKRAIWLTIFAMVTGVTLGELYQAFAQELPVEYPHQTVYAYTGQVMTATVCIPEAVDPKATWPNFSVEWKLLHFESGTQMAQGTSTEPTFTFSVPRTGFFVLQVQYDKGDGSPLSGWKDSRHPQPAVPDGPTHCNLAKPGGFWVHGETAPAGSGGID